MSYVQLLKYHVLEGPTLTHTHWVMLTQNEASLLVTACLLLTL